MSDSEDNGKALEITAQSEDEKTRLDHFVNLVPEVELTRTSIQKLIVEGQILVNGQAVAKNYRLRVGDTVSITVPPVEPTVLIGEDIALEIAFEDEFIAVINKPAGLVTHPGVGNRSGTLVNALIHHFETLPTVGESDRPGIVHRLDKETSGLMVVAKENRAFQRLQDALRRREIKRTYTALICGHLAQPEGTIDLPIGRSLKNRRNMCVTSHNGRESQTDYRMLERYQSYDLVEVTLQTGRTHQIRVHFTHLGHPVFGDPNYGGREKYLGGMFGPERPLGAKLLALLDRQALHASKLEFKHPITGEELLFEAEIPDDFGRVLRLLRSEDS